MLVNENGEENEQKSRRTLAEARSSPRAQRKINELLFEIFILSSNI